MALPNPRHLRKGELISENKTKINSSKIYMKNKIQLTHLSKENNYKWNKLFIDSNIIVGPLQTDLNNKFIKSYVQILQSKEYFNILIYYTSYKDDIILIITFHLCIPRVYPLGNLFTQNLVFLSILFWCRVCV